VLVLRKVLDQLIGNLSSQSLFPKVQVIHFRPQSPRCPRCDMIMNVEKTRTKRAATLPIGTFTAHETLLYCRICGYSSGSQELRSIIAEKCNFGYDVLEQVGKALFLRFRNADEIVKELADVNIGISDSEIGYLAGKFIVYLSLIHHEIGQGIRAFMNLQGGYILHLDGTCEGSSPHLISVLDGISEIVLDNIKTPSENSEHLIPFLQKIKKPYGDPVAVVSDMHKGILKAIHEVFKGVPSLVCHYHFLKDLGKDLFGKEHDVLRSRLSHHGIKGKLKAQARKLKNIMDTIPVFVQEFAGGIEDKRIQDSCPIEHLSLVATYFYIMWALQGEACGKGLSFPFDQRYLVFFRRLQVVYGALHRLHAVKLGDNQKDNRIYSRTRCQLKSVIGDSALKKAAASMEEKVKVFNRLRSAMRIMLPESKKGLNDEGELVKIKTIEKAVQKFRDQLCREKDFPKDKTYKNMVGQIDNYWRMLFADPIVVKTEAGNIILQPQRTNNVLERFFRSLSRGHRKRSGTSAMEKMLKAMLPATPLASNLKNKGYMEILLNGKRTLAERFADIDSTKVREEMRRISLEKEISSPKIRKILKNPQLPEEIISAYSQIALSSA